MDQLAQPASTSIDMAPNISLTDIYTQALTSMRATDDISLRLLAAVPFVRQNASRAIALYDSYRRLAGDRPLCQLTPERQDRAMRCAELADHAEQWRSA
jgi:hypothetical protein